MIRLSGYVEQFNLMEKNAKIKKLRSDKNCSEYMIEKQRKWLKIKIYC